MGSFDVDNYWSRLAGGRVNRRRLLRGGVAVSGMAALGLAGCSSSSNNNNNTAATVTATKAAASSSVPAGTPAATRAATAAAVAGSPAASAATAGGSPAAAAVKAPPPAGNFKTGGTINYVTTGTTNLDPVENTSFRSQEVAGHTYSRLFRFNSGVDPKTSLSREPIPDLVSSYQMSPDGLTYTMKLRQGVNFHPPLSRPLTSADVKASWERFTTDAKNTNNNVYEPIVDSFSTPDDSTVVFKLKQPYTPFLNKLANPQYLFIMPKEINDNKIDPAVQMIGTGPWIYVNSTPTAFTWKKNPDYFIKGLPYADGLQRNIIAATATQEAQFQAGQIDVLAIPESDVDAIKKAIPKASVVDYVPNGLHFLFFYNVLAPDSPFKDERVRQAASLALDRQALIEALYGKDKAVFTNIVNAGLGKWFLDPQGKDIGDAAKWFQPDPKAAKQLLDAAGQTNTTFKFYYPNNAYGDTFNATSDAVRGQLADAGFKMEVVTVDYLKDWINNGLGYFNKGVPQNGIASALQTPFTEPDDFLTGMLTKAGNRNHDLLDDPELAAIVKKQQVENDDAKRLQLVYDAQRLANNKMYYVPIIYTKASVFTQPWVQSYFVADDYNAATESLAYMSVNNK
jgi:peptide/nickel transport system substrate-binding protein